MGGWNSGTTLLEKAVLRPIKQQSGGGGWREPFRILTTLLLSLLLPLSFLLLARLSTARHISAAAATSQPSTNCRDDDHLLCFLFLFCYFINTSTILYALVSLITVAAFVRGLTAGPLASSNVTSSNRRCQSLVSDKPDVFRRPRLYAAWIILCTLQICVGLGIEGTISTDAGGSLMMMRSSSSSATPGWLERISSLLSRVIFFVGLHETAHFWSKSVVKPVVDDTVMGCVVKEERWIERVGMAMSFGALWWWKLRDEVDALAVVWELIVKKELGPSLLVVQARGAGGLGVADLVGWWLYYLTVTIGNIRLIKGGIWLGMILLYKFRRGYVRRQDSVSGAPTDDSQV